MASIKADVVDPSVEMQPWMLLLEGAEDGLEESLGEQGCLWASSCHAPGYMKPLAEFSIRQDCFWPRVHLHGKLQCNGWVLEGLGHLLKSGQVNGVMCSKTVMPCLPRVLLLSCLSNRSKAT